MIREYDSYNAIIREFGEEIGLAYENLVTSYVCGEETTGDIMLIAHMCKNLRQAMDIITTARNHAEHEIEYARQYANNGK